MLFILRGAENFSRYYYFDAEFYEQDPRGSEGEYWSSSDRGSGGDGDFKFIKRLEAGSDYYLSVTNEHSSWIEEGSLGIHLEKLENKNVNRLESVSAAPYECVLSPDSYNSCLLYIYNEQYEDVNEYDNSEQYQLAQFHTFGPQKWRITTMIPALSPPFPEPEIIMASV